MTNKAFPFVFKPLEVFTWYREDIEKFIGEYHPGMTYNCTLEARHDALRTKCKEWEEQGKIEVIPLKPNQSFKTVEVK